MNMKNLKLTLEKILIVAMFFSLFAWIIACSKKDKKDKPAVVDLAKDGKNQRKNRVRPPKDKADKAVKADDADKDAKAGDDAGDGDGENDSKDADSDSDSKDVGSEDGGDDGDTADDAESADALDFTDKVDDRQPAIVLDIVDVSLDDPSHLQVAKLMTPKIIRHATLFTGKLYRTRLAGQVPSAQYNYVRWQSDRNAKDIGIVLQAWRYGSHEEMLKHFDQRYEQSFGGRMVEVVGLTAFETRHHGVLGLTYAAMDHPWLVSLTCSASMCSPDQMLDLAEDTAKQIK